MKQQINRLQKYIHTYIYFFGKCIDALACRLGSPEDPRESEVNFMGKRVWEVCSDPCQTKAIAWDEVLGLGLRGLFEFKL